MLLPRIGKYFEFKTKLLVILYFSYIWIPIRRKLLKDVYSYELTKSCYTFDLDKSKLLDKIETIVNKDYNLSTIPKFWLLYQIVSSILHVVNIILCTLLLSLKSGNPVYDLLYCYGPKLIVHETLGNHYLLWFSLVLSILHIMWRFIILVLEHDFRLPLITFIVGDNELISITSTSLDNKYKTYRALSKDGISPLEHCLFSIKEEVPNNNNSNKDIDTNCFSRHFIQNSYNYYYKYKFLLRPNRTLKARKKITNYIDGIFEINFRSFLSSAIVLLPIAVRTIWFKQYFIYDNCNNHEMFTLTYFVRGGLSSTVTLLLYIDSFAGIFFPTSMVYILTYDLLLYWSVVKIKINKLLIGLTVPYYNQLLKTGNYDVKKQCKDMISNDDYSLFCEHTYDIKLYNNNDNQSYYDYYNYYDDDRLNFGLTTSGIVDKIKNTKQSTSKGVYFRSNLNNNSIIVTNQNKNNSIKDYLTNNTKKMGHYNNNIDGGNDDEEEDNSIYYNDAANDNSFHLNGYLEKDITQLQSMLADFFKQLIYADKILSVIMAFVLVVWLVSNTVITLAGLQLTSGSLIIRAIQVVGLLVVTVQTYYIIYMNRKTRSIYKSLASLMTLDETVYKRRWIDLLKYYTEKPRYGITLMHKEPYTLLTFFKFFSYTITSIFIIDNLKHLL